MFGREGLWSWGEDAEGDDTSRTEKGGVGGGGGGYAMISAGGSFQTCLFHGCTTATFPGDSMASRGWSNNKVEGGPGGGSNAVK